MSAPEPFAGPGASCAIFRDAPALDGARTAAVGRFACEDARAGAALLEAAAARLAAEGFRALLGPMDGDTWHAYRLVTWSDGSPPFALEPVSGPHDGAAFASAGFAPAASYVSARAPVPEAPSPPAAVPGVALRFWDGRDGAAVVDRVFALSEVAFAGNPFYKPIARDALRALYAPVLPRLDPRFVAFAADEATGEDLGFVFGLPDLAQGPRPSSVILKTYASRRPGVGRLLAGAFHEAARAAGFATVVHALMHEANASAARSPLHAGEVFRRYALLARRLAP